MADLRWPPPRASIGDGLLTDRRTPPAVADAVSARAPALRPGPGLREDVDHGGSAGALLPLLRVRPRGGDGLLLLRELAYAGVRRGRPTHARHRRARLPARRRRLDYVLPVDHRGADHHRGHAGGRLSLAHP